MRDIINRLVPLAEVTVENIRSLGSCRFPFVTDESKVRVDIQAEVETADKLLAEARAAIGEDKV